MFTVLVVEDDDVLLTMFCTILRKKGYQAIGTSNGLEALHVLDRDYIDIIVSDVMMPQMDGYELTRSLRDAKYDIPILLVTAKDSLQDKKIGFRAGSDDYMVKPIDVEEMVLRVEALLRRAKIVSDRKLTIGGTVLDWDALTVTTNSDTALLPKKEFYLLYKLVSYPERIFTRQQLMDEIWGPDTQSDARTVDVHIGRLRDRFKGSPDIQLITVRGLGYKAVLKE